MKDANRFIPSKTIHSDIEIPRTFWICAFILCMLPLFCQWITQFEKPTQSLITSGLPDHDVALVLTQTLGQNLSKNEKLLWVGQPEPGRETATKLNWLFLIFIDIWLVLPLLWICGALHFKFPSLQNLKEPGIAALAAPFFLFGLTLATMPIFTYTQDLKTINVITNAHAFKIVDNKPRLLTSFNWRAFGPIKLVPYSSTRADVMFAKTYSDDNRPNIGFYGIEQADKVTDILETFLAARKTENLDPHEHFVPAPPSAD